MRVLVFAALCGAMAGPGCYVESTSEEEAEDVGEISAALQPGGGLTDDPVEKCLDACRKLYEQLKEICSTYPPGPDRNGCYEQAGKSYSQCSSDCYVGGGCNGIDMPNCWGQD